ncbi:hypothetical protein RhiirB3_438053, partial [Rhizophagus irregularis]
WTSGNNDIDKFIQDTQLSAHDATKALEWIPYDRLDDFSKNKFGKVYKANWIDGKIEYWNSVNQNWKRNRSGNVILKSLNNLKNIAIEFTNEVNIPFGITQDPKTDNYMIVLNYKCKKCSSICNTIHFQYKFIDWTSDWTSGNNDIDKLIQDTQLSSHKDLKEVLEWIPYDSFYNIKYIAEDEFGKVYRANWIDGNISDWDNKYQNWKREGCNMFVNLKSLNNSKNIPIKFTNKIKIDYEFYGITQDSETKNYMIVLNNKCKKCNAICNPMDFQQNFENCTSDNDKFIQDTELSEHTYCLVKKYTLEQIPYDSDISKNKFVKVYKANWIDGEIYKLNNTNHNWIRYRSEDIILKSLCNSKNITIKFTNEINVPFEITQDPETRNYIMVWNYKCKKCNSICNTMHFQHKFMDWTSGNNDIDKFIQDTQLSAHNDLKEVLEWIPYSRLYNIKYIADADEFSKMYRANWIGGEIESWDNKNEKWIRYGSRVVILKSLNNLKNIRIKLIDEV